jgi:DNA-binding transcriptional ArsR family regulator
MMESSTAIEALSALAHPGRLGVFRLLIQAGPEGLAAGEAARRLGTPANTMSNHLAVLNRAGLIRSQRQSRSINYRADVEAFSTLLGFLLEDCCEGRPEICAPLFAKVETARACAGETKSLAEIIHE